MALPCTPVSKADQILKKIQQIFEKSSALLPLIGMHGYDVHEVLYQNCEIHGDSNSKGVNITI